MSRRRYRDSFRFLTSPKAMYALISIMFFLMVIKVALQIVERYYGQIVLLLFIAIIGYYFYRHGSKLLKALHSRG